MQVLIKDPCTDTLIAGIRRMDSACLFDLQDQLRHETSSPVDSTHLRSMEWSTTLAGRPRATLCCSFLRLRIHDVEDFVEQVDTSADAEDGHDALHGWICSLVCILCIEEIRCDNVSNSTCCIEGSVIRCLHGLSSQRIHPSKPRSELLGAKDVRKKNCHQNR